MTFYLYNTHTHYFICLHTHTYICIYTYTHYISIYTHTIPIYIHTHTISIYLYIYLHIYICMSIHTQTYTHRVRRPETLLQEFFHLPHLFFCTPQQTLTLIVSSFFLAICFGEAFELYYFYYFG